jgi:hypothetical protein
MDINKSKPEKPIEFPTKVGELKGEDNPLWVDEQENEKIKKEKQVEEEEKRLDDISNYLKPEYTQR